MLRIPLLLLLFPILAFAGRQYGFVAGGDGLVYTGGDGGPSPQDPKLKWDHPPPAASQGETQTWTLGSTQTLKWHAAYPTVFALNLVQEGNPEEAKILPDLRYTKGVTDQELPWVVCLQSLNITESRVFSLEVVAGPGGEQPESQRSAQFVIAKAEAEAVPDRTFSPSKPQAATATTVSGYPATTLTTVSSPSRTASNTRTDSFTFQPPSSATSTPTSSPTALEAHHENDGPKYRVITAVAAIAAVAGVVSILGFGFWLWRRVTGMRMAAVAPGHHVVGPNEFVVMGGEAWLDKTR